MEGIAGLIGGITAAATEGLTEIPSPDDLQIGVNILRSAAAGNPVQADGTPLAPSIERTADFVQIMADSFRKMTEAVPELGELFDRPTEPGDVIEGTATEIPVTGSDGSLLPENGGAG